MPIPTPEEFRSEMGIPAPAPPPNVVTNPHVGSPGSMMPGQMSAPGPDRVGLIRKPGFWLALLCLGAGAVVGGAVVKAWTARK